MTTDTVEKLRKLQRDQVEREHRVTEMRRSLELLHEPGTVFEIRALHVGRVKTVSGYFNDVETAAKAVYDVDQRKAVGVYVTLNPCNPALLSRANNRMVDWPKSTTTDAEIVRRRWLFIDIDPARPSGIGSTDVEKRTAQTLVADIEEALRQRGWSYPLLADSGNGAYLLYRVDLPNDDEATKLLKAFYGGLNTLLGNYDPTQPHSQIDLSVYNAARILRIGGTLNRKGDSTPDRPHRFCAYQEPVADCPVDVIPVELIREVAELALLKTTTTSSAAHTGNGRVRHNERCEYRRLDVQRYLRHYRVDFQEKDTQDGVAYRVTCPFNDQHGSNGESAVLQRVDGQVAYRCMHNSCSGRRWSDFRDAVGLPLPEHYDGGPQRANGRQTRAGHGDDQQSQATGETSPDDTVEAEKPRFTNIVDSVGLLAMDLRSSFLVKKILVAGQPCVVGGRSKTLKTSIVADMVVSLGTGTPFLGEFETQRQRALFMSSESGASAIRETAVRIAKAKRVQLTDAAVFWGFSVPQLSRHDHLQALADLITEKSIDVVVIDPLYLALLSPELANSAGNIFAMGAALGPLSEIGQQTNATIIVLHHFRKTGAVDHEEPAGLEELAQAGVAEWARQWVLLQRREPYQADGTHKLWMRCGGSAGHAGLYAVDVEEGVYDPDTRDGRRWEIAVRNTTDAKAEVERERQERKAREQERRDNDHVQRLRTAMQRFPKGETSRTLRTAARLNSENFDRAIMTLEQDGLAQAVTIQKDRRKYAGWKPKKPSA